MKYSPHAWLLFPLFFLPSCNAPQSNRSEEPQAALPPRSASVKPGINDDFLADDLQVEAFIQRFEGESREIAKHHESIQAAVGLRTGQSVADIGAGTGLFLEGFARAVGPSGKLVAVDLSPQFIAHLDARIAAAGWSHVETVLCSDDDVRLAPHSIDVAFICDTYHHFEYPERTMASIHRALKPGGALCVVDFHRIPGVSREWLLGHVRAGQEVFRAEIEAAGFACVEEVKIDGLQENYFLRFRRK